MKGFPILRLALIFGWLVLLFGKAKPARADIAPPEPGVGSNLFPATAETNVRMLAETVEIEVAARSQNPFGEAVISASFQMRNLGEDDEEMAVRFPLCASAGGIDFQKEIQIPGIEDSRLYAAYPPVEDFSAWVEDRPVQIQTTYETIIDYRQTDALGRSKERQVPCWAHFPVRFPAGEEFNIRVRYTQQGYPAFSHGEVANYLQFSYYLFTGAAWKDTIGSAEILVKLPMVADSATVSTALPQGAQFLGSEIRWYFEDFEPSGNQYSSTPEDPGALVFIVMHPTLADQIAKARQRVADRPEDGDAWGQVGKAYKAAVKMERGLRDDEMGQEMYRLSLEAYQKSVDLLPNDADWHFGFAELACWKVQWYSLSGDTGDDYALCIRELRRALELNSRHTRALALLQELSDWDLVVLTEPAPAFHTVTPRPTELPVFTETPVSTATPPSTPTPTPFTQPPEEMQPSPSGEAAPALEETATQQATYVANLPSVSSNQQATEAPPPSSPSSSICSAPLAPAFLALGLFLTKSASRKFHR